MSDPVLKGDGAQSVALEVHGGQVVLLFDRPARWVLLEAQVAFELAEKMARMAHRAKYGEDPPSDQNYIAAQVRARVTDELRDRMVTRAAIMLRSMQDQNKGITYQALQVVDSIFAEVA